MVEVVQIPDFSIKIGLWIVEQYDNRKETWFESPDGRVFIVKLTTEIIEHIPYYVLEKVNKLKILEAWRQYQVNLALERIRTAIQNYQNFLDHKQPIETSTCTAITTLRPFKIDNVPT